MNGDRPTPPAGVNPRQGHHRERLFRPKIHLCLDLLKGARLGAAAHSNPFCGLLGQPSLEMRAFFRRQPTIAVAIGHRSPNRTPLFGRFEIKYDEHAVVIGFEQKATMKVARMCIGSPRCRRQYNARQTPSAHLRRFYYAFSMSHSFVCPVVGRFRG